MTMLETLDFIDQLHGHIVHGWPTPSISYAALLNNRDCFPDKDPRRSFNVNFIRAAKRGWIAIGPCSKDCRERHLRITKFGQEMLALMKEKGCQTGDHVRGSARTYHFERTEVA